MDSERVKKEIDSLKKEIKDRKETVLIMQQQLKEKEDQLDNLVKFLSSDIKVSEHCIVRYCERKLKINVTFIRQSIVAKHKEAIYMMGGNGRIKDDDIEFVVKDFTVVTIV